MKLQWLSEETSTGRDHWRSRSPCREPRAIAVSYQLSVKTLRQKRLVSVTSPELLQKYCKHSFYLNDLVSKSFVFSTVHKVEGVDGGSLRARSGICRRTNHVTRALSKNMNRLSLLTPIRDYSLQEIIASKHQMTLQSCLYHDSITHLMCRYGLATPMSGTLTTLGL